MTDRGSGVDDGAHTTTLRTLEDRVEIGELLAHYCYLLDSRQWDRLSGEVFAPDALDDHGLGQWRGAAAITAGFRAVMAHFSGTMHSLSNPHLELEGDRARSRCYVTAWHWLDGDNQTAPAIRPADFLVIGAYLDDLERRPEGWRITQRRFRPVGEGVLGIGELPDFLARR